MSCTRDFSYQNSYGSQPVTIILNKCSEKNKGYFPSFTPVISTLSVTTSASGVYSLVYINGSNFIPLCNGVIYVNFGSFKNLPITFYNSFNISFVVPLNAPIGNYNVVVVNVYNNNFSPSVHQINTGNPNYSNSVTYTIT